MLTTLEYLSQRAKDLPDTEKLALVDELLVQLDRLDPTLDQAWINEVRKRRQAYREGRLEARPYNQVMGTFARP